MKYTFESRVRFSEIDSTRHMTLPAVVNYFQDCSTLQSEDMGLGFRSVAAIKKVWILSSWQIEVDRYPMMGEHIKITTWSTGFEGLYGKRNFVMETPEGERLAWANSLWVYMDLEKGRPVRPDAETQQMYGADAPLDVEFAPRKIELPKTVEERESFPVRRQQIDTNDHVNNCQYIQMAIEVLPECGRAKKIRVEYKKSAVFGDVICPKVAIESDRKVVELCDADENIFAVVEIKE